jgi:hypothetical protein
VTVQLGRAPSEFESLRAPLGSRDTVELQPTGGEEDEFPHNGPHGLSGNIGLAGKAKTGQVEQLQTSIEIRRQLMSDQLTWQVGEPNMELETAVRSETNAVRYRPLYRKRSKRSFGPQ